MKHILHSQQGQHLIIYFAGWGTPPSLVNHLVIPENTDLCICYDYQDLRLPLDISAYHDIHLVAWSLGVWVAERALRSVKLSSATAINGSGLPCDDNNGIPEVIFQQTLALLSEKTRQRFDRRLSLDPHYYAFYQQLKDYRSLENIREELSFLSKAIHHDTRHDLLQWDHAFISRNDAIFPAENLVHYWQGRTNIRFFEEGHLIFPALSHWTQCWE